MRLGRLYRARGPPDWKMKTRQTRWRPPALIFEEIHEKTGGFDHAYSMSTLPFNCSVQGVEIDNDWERFELV